MVRIFASPGRYIQGFGEIRNLEKHVGKLGNKFYVVASRNRIAQLKNLASKSFEGTGKELIFDKGFCGEVTLTEIDRLADEVISKGCDVVIGMGGGKVMDCAKAVAEKCNVDVVIVPTTAATDAATSALSAIYDEQGLFTEVRTYAKSPAVVLVDTEISTMAPASFLIAGIGDALATYFEALACKASNAANMMGGSWTLTSIDIAKVCFETLMEYGPQAVLAVENNLCTEALERVIEANTLMSGLGFESNGLSVAHDVYTGFTGLPQELYTKNHGEYVSFGVLVQLIMEAAKSELIDRIYRFCIAVKLPVTFADLDLPNLSDEHIDVVVDYALKTFATCKNEPFDFAARTFADAIKMADVIGKKYKAGDSILY